MCRISGSSPALQKGKDAIPWAPSTFNSVGLPYLGFLLSLPEGGYVINRVFPSLQEGGYAIPRAFPLIPSEGWICCTSVSLLPSNSLMDL